jgi:hypothetical protein
MSYTTQVSEVLEEFNGTLYKMIRIKLISSSGRFPHRAMPPVLKITNGTNEASAFLVNISGNQLEIESYFAMDAFTGYSAASTLEFGYGSEYGVSVSSVDVTNPITLLSFMTAVPHTILTNAIIATF